MLSLFISISGPLYLPTLITPFLLPPSLSSAAASQKAELKVIAFPVFFFFFRVVGLFGHISLIHLSNWLEEKTLQKLYLFALNLHLSHALSICLFLIHLLCPHRCPICFDLCVIDMVITQSTDWWQRCHNRGDWSGLPPSPFSQLLSLPFAVSCLSTFLVITPSGTLILPPRALLFVRPLGRDGPSEGG